MDPNCNACGHSKSDHNGGRCRRSVHFAPTHDDRECGCLVFITGAAMGVATIHGAHATQTELTLLATLKAQIEHVRERRRIAAEAKLRADSTADDVVRAEKARDEANAAYQSHLHGHAVEVKVTQPSDCEDDCG